MKLGGPIFADISTPDLWVAAVKAHGYGACSCPLNADASDDTIAAYVAAAKEAGIVIAEVGAWSNPISPDDETRTKALTHCKAQLALAERVGARCCVNIVGGRGAQWDGPHPDNFSRDTFDLIVETVRDIIDSVNPTRTCYALETMPWIYPDSPDSYLEILKAIDRKAFGVHLDPVNMISSPRRYFENGAFIKECFTKLGPYIKTCHGKDILLRSNLTVHLDEVQPGHGALDYRIFLTELNKLDPDTSLILEHMSEPQQYVEASAYVRGVAAELGLRI
jgi:sugar phosphate isomerase/epimerase